MRTRLMIVVLLGLAGFASTVLGRTWTRKDGKTVEAEMTDVKGENVGLRTRDGRVYYYPIKDLSQADQAYVRERQRQGAATPSPGPTKAVETDSKPERPAKPTGLDQEKGSRAGARLWQRATAARLVVPSFAKLMDDAKPVELDAKQFPKVPFDLKKFREHMGKAAEAAQKRDFRIARMRATANMSVSILLNATYTMYLFADSEDEWPKGTAPLRIRVHGKRIGILTAPAILRIESIDVPDAELSELIAMSVKDVEKKDSDKKTGANKEADEGGILSAADYDLILTGTLPDEHGIIRGTLTGRFSSGEKVKDAKFELAPYTAEGKPIAEDAAPK